MLALLPLLLAAAPARVVSMAPSLTDLAVELKATALLVGVSRFDEAPELAGLPRIGGYLDPDLEAVVRLRPDLVLALDGVSFAPSLRALRAAGLRVLPLRTDTLEEIHASVLALGAALERGPPAEALWRELSALVETARAAQAGRRPVRVALAVGFRPLVLAGRGSYLEPLLEAAGGENVSASRLAWPTSSIEQLVAARPEVIVDGGGAEDGPASERVLDLLRRGGSHVARVSGDLFRPGVRAIRALPELSRALEASR